MESNLLTLIDDVVAVYGFGVGGLGQLNDERTKNGNVKADATFADKFAAWTACKVGGAPLKPKHAISWFLDFTKLNRNNYQKKIEALVRKGVLIREYREQFRLRAIEKLNVVAAIERVEEELARLGPSLPPCLLPHEVFKEELNVQLKQLTESYIVLASSSESGSVPPDGFSKVLDSLQRALGELLGDVERQRALIMQKVQALYADHYKSVCADLPPAHVKFRLLFSDLSGGFGSEIELAMQEGIAAGTSMSAGLMASTDRAYKAFKELIPADVVNEYQHELLVSLLSNFKDSLKGLDGDSGPDKKKSP